MKVKCNKCEASYNIPDEKLINKERKVKCKKCDGVVVIPALKSEVKREVNENLTDCTACNKSISILTETCPSCGAPNEWVHPDINNFVSLKDSMEVPEEFTFECNKTEIWGKTEKDFPWWLWFVVFLFSAPGFAFGFIPGLIIAPITYFILVQMYGKNKEFKADLKKRTWESSDDEFWVSVRSALNL